MHNAMFFLIDDGVTSLVASELFVVQEKIANPVIQAQSSAATPTAGCEPAFSVGIDTLC